MKYISILIFAFALNAQTMLYPDRTSYWGAAAPAGGPDVWYYSEGGDSHNGLESISKYNLEGDTVSITQAGTIDSVRIYVEISSVARDCQFTLYYNNGGTWTKNACDTVTIPAWTEAWVSYNITNYSASSSEEVLMVMTGGSFNVGMLASGVSGFFHELDTDWGAGGGCTSTTAATSTTDDICIGLYVD